MINGPNLNLLGLREPAKYGTTSLAELESSANDQARALGADLECYQSNHEGYIIDRIHDAWGDIDMIIINAG